MSTPDTVLLNQKGFTLRQSILTTPEISRLALRIDAQYQTLEAARRRDGLAALSELVPSGQKFAATASSLTLGAVFAHDEIHALLAAISIGPAAEWARQELPNRIACDVDQAWVRRQYAPTNYPAFHSPHGWHQDGALGFDFLSHGHVSFLPEALLSMVTCWIALSPCGTEAPGLELVTQRLETLLPPVELADARVHERFPPEDFWRPAIEPGDALLFRGDILHRTHVTPAMVKDRTSIEFRFFPANALPQRLSGDRFVLLD
jgi:ectoine hydroxylase-related dioxygenase (phytanoyl-CoA dioxygenase family)